MIKFYRRYMSLKKFGTDDTEGIEMGRSYVFAKVDGTNAQLWFDGQEIQAGSRNRQLTLDNDNAGFYAAMIEDERALKFFDKYPDIRLYGEWLCLSGDTEVRLVSGGKRGSYMTLRDMYKYATTPVEEVSNYVKKDGTRSINMRPSWWERNGYPQLFSWFEDEDVVKPQKMAKIIYTGDKEVFMVTTRKGKQIKSTQDHRFLTNEGWKHLKDIGIGDVVATTELSNYRPHRRYGKGTKEIQRTFEGLKTKGVCADCGLGSCLEIHHVDCDWKNNSMDNLQVLCKDCHGKKHHNISAANQEYDYEFDKVVSIELVGVEDCYDISMNAPENSSSFVANNFIVHNCPHTLKTYREDAWKKFYVFDVVKELDPENGQSEDSNFIYLDYEQYQPMLEEFGLDYINPLGVVKNGSLDKYVHYLESNGFLIKDGAGVGEGVVIKNYDYQNKFGRIIWAKIVTNEFKERHYKAMGAPEVELKPIEEKIAEKYATGALIEKEYAKIVHAEGKWESKFIPRLLNTVYYCLVTEELWNAVKEFKNPTISFKALQNFTFKRVKEIKQELF